MIPISSFKNCKISVSLATNNLANWKKRKERKDKNLNLSRQRVLHPSARPSVGTPPAVSPHTTDFVNSRCSLLGTPFVSFVLLLETHAIHVGNHQITPFALLSTSFMFS